MATTRPDQGPAKKTASNPTEILLDKIREHKSEFDSLMNKIMECLNGDISNPNVAMKMVNLSHELHLKIDSFFSEIKAGDLKRKSHIDVRPGIEEYIIVYNELGKLFDFDKKFNNMEKRNIVRHYEKILIADQNPQVISIGSSLTMLCQNILKLDDDANAINVKYDKKIDELIKQKLDLIEQKGKLKSMPDKSKKIDAEIGNINKQITDLKNAKNFETLAFTALSDKSLAKTSAHLISAGIGKISAEALIDNTINMLGSFNGESEIRTLNLLNEIKGNIAEQKSKNNVINNVDILIKVKYVLATARTSSFNREFISAVVEAEKLIESKIFPLAQAARSSIDILLKTTDSTASILRRTQSAIGKIPAPPQLETNQHQQTQPPPQQSSIQPEPPSSTTKDENNGSDVRRNNNP